MKVRGAVKPPTTWSFRKSTRKDRILCDHCANNDKKDSCPRFRLSAIQRKELIATRCNFYEPDQTNNKVI